MFNQQKGGHIEGQEQGPVTVTLFQWNSEQGFGFVNVDGQRVFVHATVINPQPKRRAPLQGCRIVIRREDIEKTAQGFRAMEAYTEEEFLRQETDRREQERNIAVTRAAVEQAVRALGEGWQLGAEEPSDSGARWYLRAPDQVATAVTSAESIDSHVQGYRFRLEQAARQEQDKRAQAYVHTLLDGVKAALPQYQVELEHIRALRRRELEYVELQKRANERYEQEKPKQITNEQPSDGRAEHDHHLVTLEDRKGKRGTYNVVRRTSLATDRYGSVINSTRLTPDERSYEADTVTCTEYKLLSGDDVFSEWQAEEEHRRHIYTDVGIDTMRWYGESNQELNTLGLRVAEDVLATLDIPPKLQERVRDFLVETGSLSLNQPAQVLEKTMESTGTVSPSNTAEDIERRDHDIDAFAALQERSPASVLRGGEALSIALSSKVQPQIYDEPNGSVAYPILQPQGTSYDEQYLLAWTRNQWQGQKSLKEVGEKYPPFSAEEIEEKRQVAWQYFVASEQGNQGDELGWQKDAATSSPVPSLPQPKMYFAPLAAMAYPGLAVDEQGVCAVQWFLDSQEAQRASDQTFDVMKQRLGSAVNGLRQRVESLRGESPVTNLAEIMQELAALESQTTSAGCHRALAKLGEVEKDIQAHEKQSGAAKQERREQIAEQHWPEIQAALQKHQMHLARYLDTEYGVPMPPSFAALKDGYPIGQPADQLEVGERKDALLTSLPLPFGTLQVYHHYRYKGEQGARRKDVGWYVYIRMEAGESSVQPPEATRTEPAAPAEEPSVAAPAQPPSQAATAGQMQDLLLKFGGTAPKKKSKKS